MAKYRIHVYVTIHEEYEVEADSEEAAREKFRNEDMKPTYTETKDWDIGAIEPAEEEDDEQRA